MHQKINFIKMDSGLLNWRQIERRHGKTFMRFKRRSIRVYRIPELQEE